MKAAINPASREALSAPIGSTERCERLRVRKGQDASPSKTPRGFHLHEFTLNCGDMISAVSAKVR